MIKYITYRWRPYNQCPGIKHKSHIRYPFLTALINSETRKYKFKIGKTRESSDTDGISLFL